MGRERLSADYYKTLRARFDGKDVEDAPAFEAAAPADPSSQWFGAHAADDETPARARFDASGLRAEADALAGLVRRRTRSEMAFGAYGLRLFVGIVWLAAAWWFLTAGASADSTQLARLFAIIGVIGAGGAVLGAIVASFSGRPAARQLKADAQSFGAQVGEEASALSDADTHSLNRVEADVFLKSMAFADGGDNAEAAFGEYLHRTEKSSRLRSTDALAALLALVAVIGLGVVTLGAQLRVPAIVTAYPLVSAAVIISAGLYAGAGLIPVFGARQTREKKVLGSALAAFRAGYESADAPAIDSLSRRMQSETTPTRDLSNHSLDDSRDANPETAVELDWRARDSGPKFVDTGFQAAPKTFRADR